MQAVETSRLKERAAQSAVPRVAIAIGLACILAATAGCSGKRRKNEILFDGERFRAKAVAVDKRADRSQFQVAVDGVSASLDGAREAGRYQGTRYCIANYGTSKIDWAVGPDTDPAQLLISNNRLTFRGACRRP